MSFFFFVTAKEGKKNCLNEDCTFYSILCHVYENV